MSMLDNLKKTKKNHVFLDEEDMDVDNMDFPLPNEPSSSRSSSNAGGMPNFGRGGMPDMAQLQQMMQGMGGLGRGGGGMPDMAQLQQMMQSMGGLGGGLGGGAPAPAPAAVSRKESVAVATTPSGTTRQMHPDEYKDWVCVYPCYIDADKTVQEGRKISKEKAAKNPHAYHMAIACQKLGFSVVYEGKRHPRDWANVGRVRVQIKNSSNFFVNADITTRKQLFVAIAKILPECQKTGSVPKSIVGPMTTLAEIEALADEQRKAQGLPTLAEMQAQNAAQQPQIPAKPKKQKIRYVRG
ncbi:signal recognition particle, SRP19 subunit [Gilbertella persicaria]|uniref:signal recognition particle, SRP19 subunit n=1 Tax=Gilbertella persicaria TaxID=101096 RepID=UPI0022200B50|nr:signal recognition particle, SRP19 subunit [Gilbertella persicaria]KAI8069758.1 signal recognition particle, SRP19 subunit [Gilbertella persicaria]